MSRNLRTFLVPSEDHRRLNEFVGLLLATLAVLIGLSLVSFNPDDPSFNISRNPNFPEKAQNFIGTLGSYVADIFLQLLGFASFLLPVYPRDLRLPLAHLAQGRSLHRARRRLCPHDTDAGNRACPSFPIIPTFRGEIPAGGVIGRILADKLEETVSTTGSIVILLSSILVSLFLTTTFSFSWAVEKLGPKVAFIGELKDRFYAWQELRREEAEMRRAEARRNRKQIVVTPREPLAALPAEFASTRTSSRCRAMNRR